MHSSPQYRDTTWSQSLAQAVREITSDAREGVPPARLPDVLVTDASEAARCVAAIGLAGDRSFEAEAALIAALQDECELVRRAAAESLFALGSVRGLAAVVAGSRHGHGIRTDAAHKLARMKPGEAADAAPALMVLLQYPNINWRTHFAVVEALRTIGDAAIPALVNGLRRGSAQVRRYAAIALKEMGKTPELLPMIDYEIRKAGLSREDEEAKAGGHSMTD